MSKHRTNRITKILLSSITLIMLLAFSTGIAFANTTANSTIMNVVQVDYDDASGNNSFVANASSLVTVNLVEAALNPSGTPTAADGSPGLTCLTPGVYESGTTVSSLYAVTATANGDDTYNFSIAADAPVTTHDVNNITRSYSTLTYDGTVEATNPASRLFGSAIPVGISGTDTLLFPGGALAGFSVNDIVLVTTDGGDKVYLVAAVNAGTAPVYDNVGHVAHTDSGSYTTTEVQGTLQLKAYADQSIALNGGTVTVGGGGNAPAFGTAGSIPTLGVPVGEMVLIRIDITASASTAGTDGAVGYTLTTTDGTNPATITCTVSVFEAVDLTIQKDVRNVTDGGTFAATATGDPSDILEYRVTVTNSGGDATSVVITDAVPAYTTLQDNVYAGSTAFAQISDGTNTVDVTSASGDSETQPATPVETGFGNAAGTAAASAITFYIGDTSTNAAGGTVDSSTTYTIIYQVKID